MNEHVSFFEQVTGTEGKPDILVHLPNQGQLTVDSKFPLQAFLEAMASMDATFRKQKLEEHAKVLRQRIKELAKKGYWEQFQPSPELVIMFIPVESCLLAAYEFDPDIIEFALSQKVILASPITLLGFMKAIAYGWQQFVITKFEFRRFQCVPAAIRPVNILPARVRMRRGLSGGSRVRSVQPVRLRSSVIWVSQVFKAHGLGCSCSVFSS